MRRRYISLQCNKFLKTYQVSYHYPNTFIDLKRYTVFPCVDWDGTEESLLKSSIFSHVVYIYTYIHISLTMIGCHFLLGMTNLASILVQIGPKWDKSDPSWMPNLTSLLLVVISVTPVRNVTNLALLNSYFRAKIY